MDMAFVIYMLTARILRGDSEILGRQRNIPPGLCIGGYFEANDLWCCRGVWDLIKGMNGMRVTTVAVRAVHGRILSLGAGGRFAYNVT